LIIQLHLFLDKSQEELEYLAMVMEHFHSHATALGAQEVGGDMAVQLLIHGKKMSSKTTINEEQQMEI
jgi:hypothetical protein